MASPEVLKQLEEIERLTRALLESLEQVNKKEWRQIAAERRANDSRPWSADTLDDDAEELAALLAESEPEPCAEWRHCEHDGEDGHIACDVLCADCGMRRDAHPDCEAKAKLGPDTQAAYENRLRISVNESCSCGGREPGPEACPACMVWHRINDGADREAKAKLPLGHEFRANVWGDNCCCYPSSHNVLKACGQPRSAHEPK